MSLDADTLYRLLPAVYRLRDETEGRPLAELIALFAGELEALEENLEQLYDDQFIETCADWAVPYIGELIGFRPLRGVPAPVSSPRAEVANTIRLRRCKGTASMLKTLARDVTGWPAHAVEFFEQLCTTQYMNHTRPHALASAATGAQRLLLGRGGPFNALAHTAEMRRPETRAGRYNIPNIGLFVWRLQPFGLTNVPLIADPGDTTGRRFRLNPLGADMRLFRHATRADALPTALSVRELALQVRGALAAATSDGAASDDYGFERSVVLARDGHDLPLRDPTLPATGDPYSQCVVRIADLRDVVDGVGNFAGWAHERDIGPLQIGLDPERGRVLLGTSRAAEQASSPFTATFHYGLARAIGGGEYERTPDNDGVENAMQRTVAAAASLQPHLDALGPGGGRLLIGDSLTYAPAPVFRVGAVADPDASGHKVVVGARNGARPLIASSTEMLLDIGARGTLVLDGLVLAGGALRLPAAGDNAPRTLVLRDCTLVPGRTLQPDGSPASTAAPSLVIEHPFTTVRLERCVTGPLHAVAESGVTVECADCIIDAARDAFAFAADGGGGAGAELALRECTVIGRVHTRLLRLASNSLFAGAVQVSRKQEGCIRFCWLPPDSVTPRRFRCQPDAQHPDVEPHFESLRYADPAYCQLRSVTSPLIREGADDGGEMGVMHALFQPQREANLRLRLDEYLRFGLRAGLFYAT
jgi:hypothetical protein